MSRAFSGQRLRAARIAAGIRPEALALSIGRSAHAVQAYELGRSLPSVSVLARLADALGQSIDAFFAELVDSNAA